MRITLEELLQNIDKAQRRMSQKNAHRVVLQQCHDALIQLATRVGELSAAQEVTDAPTD